MKSFSYRSHQARHRRHKWASLLFYKKRLVNFGYDFWRNFSAAVKRKQTVRFLFNIRELRVAKTRHEFQLENSFHQVAIFRNKLVHGNPAAIKIKKHVSLNRLRIVRNF